MPIPSGWRWLGRLAVGLVLVALLLAGAWYYWMRESERRMDKTISDIRARGEMVSWSELEITPVPDAQNAAWYLNRAAAATVLPPKQPTAYERARAKATGVPATQPATGPDATRANVAANAQSLSLLRQARGYSGVFWVPKPPSGPPIPVYTNQSALAKLARDAAILAHENGNDREAMELWRDIDAQARSIGSGPVLLIGGLVSLIVDGIGVDTMLTIAPDLRIGDDGIAPAEVRQLISELLDDGCSRDAIARGWKAERTSWTDTYLANPPSSFMAPLLVSHMHKYCLMFDGLSADTQALRSSPPFEVDEYVRLIGVIPQFGGVTTDVIKYTIRRRVAAMILAIRLYHHDHGEYPPSVNAIVPDYLDSIPIDPAIQKPLIYVPLEGARRPVVLVPSYPGPTPKRDQPLRGPGHFDASPSRDRIEDHDEQPKGGR